MEIDHPFLQSLRNNLNTHRKNKMFCDFELRTCDKESVRVHKIILISSPTFFKYMIENNGNKDYLDLETTKEILDIILDYLYTGYVNVIDLSKAKSLFMYAQRYNLKFLQDHSTNTLRNAINHATCLDIWRHANSFRINPLQEACAQYISANVKQFMAGFGRELTPEELKALCEWNSDKPNQTDLFLGLKVWLKENFDQRKDDFAEMVEKFDLSSFDDEFFTNDIIKDSDLQSVRNFSHKIAQTFLKKQELAKLQKIKDEEDARIIEEEKAKGSEAKNEIENQQTPPSPPTQNITTEAVQAVAPMNMPLKHLLDGRGLKALINAGHIKL